VHWSTKRKLKRFHFDCSICSAKKMTDNLIMSKLK
jgi:hypothetical protein